jgi:CRP/FNR family transcriptional regulator, cyclic AMP receptor protein
MIPIEIFSHNTSKITIQAGEALFREGDEGNQMFVLETGTAEVIVQNRVLETLAHGSIVGEVGLVSPGPHSASVIAKTDCDFVAVDEKTFSVPGATNAVFCHSGHAPDG